jgi:hypothetical protein
MDPTAHALLELPAAMIVVAGGVIVLALAWRRSVRGESSGVVIHAGSGRETLVAIARVPVVGLLASAIVVVGAAVLNGRLG